MQSIILGDVHLGKGVAIGKAGIGAVLNSRIVDQINLLDWTLDQAIANSVDNIIITGDIFEDPKPHPSLIAIFIAWLKKCQAYQVNTHIIMGNHDMLRIGAAFTSPLDIISEMDLDGIYIYKHIDTIILDSTAFTFVPFRDRKSFSVTSNAEALNVISESLVYELAGIPPPFKKVLIGHLAIEGSIPVGDEIDDVTNELFCSTDMFNGYDYVWMGHVHKPQIMKKSNPYIAHIGSMDISNFGETDQEKHIIIFDCASGDGKFISKKLPTRSLRKISITIPKDTQDTTNYVIDEIKKNQINLNQAIVKVDIVLEAPELESINKNNLEKFLTQQGVFNVSGISESKKTALIKKDTSSGTSLYVKMDVPNAIKAYADLHIDTNMQKDYIEEALSIYNSFKSEGKE